MLTFKPNTSYDSLMNAADVQKHYDLHALPFAIKGAAGHFFKAAEVKMLLGADRMRKLEAEIITYVVETKDVSLAYKLI
jgi:hypothetical protein